jgi:hypothetical protein
MTEPFLPSEIHMSHLLLVVLTSVQSRAIVAHTAAARSIASRTTHDAFGDRGQTTAEYALVLLGAAGVAMLLLGWATKSGAIGKLFDVVLSGIVGRVK